MTANIRGPTIGLLSDQKDTGQRVDFKRDDFVLLIETKGIRLAWSRMTFCPCAPINTETGQADPNCPRCGGRGQVFFRPTAYAIPSDAEELDDVQRAIVDEEEAAIIRGVVMGVNRRQEEFDKLGDWIWGSFMVSVRHENRLNFHDTLVALDALMSYSQVVEVAADGTVPTRYKPVSINTLQSVDTVYDENKYNIDAAGQVYFLTGHEPAASTRVTIHYDYHPRLIVWEHPNAFRDSLDAFKIPSPTTPLGDPQRLPIRVMAKLDFLVT